MSSNSEVRRKRQLRAAFSINSSCEIYFYISDCSQNADRHYAVLVPIKQHRLKFNCTIDVTVVAKDS